ncbi:MAG: class I SAM-dependent methyltransferase [Thermoleophilaceae bacterium]|nr:class I SAM-dependent methyltransferase [Thermoleophilaceae bacterium]
MRTLDFLSAVHELLAPPTYLEIGVRHGNSLTLSRSPSIAIDPRMKPSKPIPEGAVLFDETSDAYFERERPLDPWGGSPVSFAYIDGMHLSEYALRDFINVERHAHWTSVVVFDDVLPRNVGETVRDPLERKGAWTGDVYKIVDILTRLRPDLITLPVATSPTGLLLVAALDPTNSTLRDHYENIVEDAVAPDPQPVPPHVLERRDALDPKTVLSGSLWPILRQARNGEMSRRKALRRLRTRVRKEFGRGDVPVQRRVLRALRSRAVRAG